MSDKALVKTQTALPVEFVIERRKALNDYVNQALKEGIDYGRVPGIDKPFLMKSGAEKILQLFNCAPVFEVIERDQNPHTGYFYVEFRARAVTIDGGLVIGEGVGCCCSWESKYRWRKEYWRGKDAPPEDEGWERGWDKKQRREFFYRRIENPDIVDTWNTTLKIGKKRSLVDLALTISGASEKFTQDVEDFFDGEVEVVEPIQVIEKIIPRNSPKAERREPSTYKRPFEPEQLRDMILQVRDTRYASLRGREPTAEEKNKQVRLLAAKMSEAFGGDDAGADGRHKALKYLFGKTSSGLLDMAEVKAILDWLVGDRDPETNQYGFKPYAVEELHAVARAQEILDGQQMLFEEESEAVIGEYDMGS